MVGFFRTLLVFLQGRKTYLAAIGLGIVTTLHALGYIDDTTRDTLIGLLSGLGLAALRIAVKK